MNRIITLLLCAVLLVSCTSVQEEREAFPHTPERIVVGRGDETVELLPGDGDFHSLFDALKEILAGCDSFDRVRLSAQDKMNELPGSGETYVELIYGEVTLQALPMVKSGGMAEKEEMEVKRLFFPLTGDCHRMFFLGKEDGYRDSVAIGSMPTDIPLIKQVNALLSRHTEGE